MRVWEILKKENIGKKYKTTIYAIEEILTIDYDENSNTFLTLKRHNHNDGIVFPLSQIYLGCILEMDFKEVK